MLGIGTAAGLVASFSAAQKAALSKHDTTPAQLYPVISGVWTSSFALGNFLGPSIGGLLYEFVGFRYTTFVFQSAGALLLLLDLYKVHRMRKLNVVLKKVRLNKIDLYERL
jgi:MFS family permease